MEQEQRLETSGKRVDPRSLRWAVAALRSTNALFVLAYLMLLPSIQGGMDLKMVHDIGHPEEPIGYLVWMWALISLLPVLGWMLVIEVVVWGLRRRWYWAWVTAIVISGGFMFFGVLALGIPTIPGAVAMWFLMQPDTASMYVRTAKPSVDTTKEESR